MVFIFRFSPFLSCNSNCTCQDDIFEPVCASDGEMYFNPCFAGCSNNFITDSTNSSTKVS